jgi:hypothetical protein
VIASSPPNRKCEQVIRPRDGNGPSLSGGAVEATSVWVNRRLLLTGAHLTANCLVGLDIRLFDGFDTTTPAHDPGNRVAIASTNTGSQGH